MQLPHTALCRVKLYVASTGRTVTSSAVATYFSGLPLLVTFGSFVISNKVTRLIAVPRMTSNSGYAEMTDVVKVND